ncbi:MAG: DUF6326 family protein [Anaerolineales bacterium]
MNTNSPGLETRKKVALSISWIFLLFNMIYADIISLMDPLSPIRKVMAGAPLPPGGLIAGAVLMETAIAMVLLSLVLKYRVNRWLNIIIAAINMVAVVTGGRGLYYIFFACIEVVCLALIIWQAFRWQNSEGNPTYNPNAS